MLDQNDLKILAGMFSASEERMMKRMDEMDTRLTAKIDGVETKLTAKIDEVDTRVTARIDSLEVQMKNSENLVMSELAKTSDYLEKKINAVQTSVDRVEQYYRVDRLESENTATLLKLYTGLRKDVDELKEKIA